MFVKNGCPIKKSKKAINELILIIRRYNLLISTSLSINEIFNYLIDYLMN